MEVFIDHGFVVSLFDLVSNYGYRSEVVFYTVIWAGLALGDGF